MFQFMKKRETMMRWFLGVVMGLIGFTMVVTLVPGPIGGTTGTRADSVADVGGQEVTLTEVQRTLEREAGGRSIPAQLRGLYTRKILDDLIYERLVELEANRLGVRVTDGGRADEIKRSLPGAFAGGGVAYLESCGADTHPFQYHRHDRRRGGRDPQEGRIRSGQAEKGRKV